MGDPFGVQAIPSGADVSFVQFIQELAEEEVPEGIQMLEDPFPSVPIPLPYTTDTGGLEANLDTLEAPFIPPPLDEEPVRSARAPGASGVNTSNKRTPTSGQDRLEKLRAKNRRGQAKYREKCKRELQQVEEQLAAKRAELAESSNRCRVLRHQRHTLLARIKATSSTSNPPVAPTPPPSHTPPVIPSSGTGEMHTQNHGQHAHPSAATAAHTSTKWGMVPTRAAHSGNFFTEYDEVPRPISSFAHCEGIRYNDAACYIPAHLPWGVNDANTVSAAISGYQYSVSAAVAQPLSEICWFNQMNYELEPDLYISHSAGAFSPECCLSLSLGYTSLTCEALFLLLEHELLQAASDPSYTPPHHPVLTSSHLRGVLNNLCDPANSDALNGAAAGNAAQLNLSSLLSRPAPPDPTALARASVRCGVNEQFPAACTVERVLLAMLRRYRALLPLDVWRAVCMSSMSVVKGSVDAMLKKAGGGGPAATTDAGSAQSECGEEDARWQFFQAQAESSDVQGSGGLQGTDSTEGAGGAEAAAPASGEEGEEVGRVRHVGESLSHRGKDVALKSVIPSNCLSEKVQVAAQCALVATPGEVGEETGEEGGEMPRAGSQKNQAASNHLLGSKSPRIHGSPRKSAGQGVHGSNSTPDEVCTKVSKDMGWEELEDASLALLQKMLQVFYEALTETPQKEEPASRTQDVVEARMFDMMATPGISCRLMFQYAPITARRMCIAHNSSMASSDIIKAERLQLKVFSYIALTGDQKAIFAGKWRTWHRRRLALDRQLASALRHLLSSAPSPDALPRGALQLACSLCHGTSTEPHSSDQKQIPGAAGPGQVKPGAAAVASTESREQSVGSLQAASQPASADLSGCPLRDEHTSAPGEPPIMFIDPRNHDMPLSTQATLAELYHIDSAAKDRAQYATVATGDQQPMEMSDPGSHLPSPSPSAGAHATPQYTHETPHAVLPCNTVGGSGHAQWGTEPPTSFGSGIHFNNKLIFTNHHEPAASALDLHQGQHRRCAAVPETDLEGSEGKVPQLLGISGSVTRKVEDALQAVRDVHTSDSLMYHEFVSMTALPSWVLSEMQHARMMASSLELGVNMVDVLRLFQSAANEQRWEALFDPVRASDHS